MDEAPKNGGGTPQEKEVVDIYFDLSHEYHMTAQNNYNKTTESFRQLEITMATILFAFVAAFPNSFVNGSTQPDQFAKILVFSGLISLAISMFCGIINQYILKIFWSKIMDRNLAINKKWLEVKESKTTVLEAKSFQKGMIGGKSRIDSTEWASILQTIFLSLGFITILIAISIKLLR